MPRRQQRLEQILADYLRAEEQEQPLDQDRLLQEHADLAEGLVSFFRNRSAMQRFAQQVQPHELLSTTSGPVTTTMRNYMPGAEIVEQKWALPPVVKAAR